MISGLGPWAKLSGLVVNCGVASVECMAWMSLG